MRWPWVILLKFINENIMFVLFAHRSSAWCRRTVAHDSDLNHQRRQDRRCLCGQAVHVCECVVVMVMVRAPSECA